MKRYRIFAGLAALFLLLAGCGQKNGNSAAANPDSDTPAKVVYGEIYEVIGNCVTVKEIEMPQVPTGEDGQPVTGERFAQSTDENGDPVRGGGFQMSTDENGDPVRGGGFQLSTDENGDPVMGGGFQLSTDENGDPVIGGGFLQQELNYTGEQVDIIIPVGLIITSTVYGDNGTEAEEMELSDLKAGSIITATYASDGVTIEKVSVMSAQIVGRGNFSAGGEAGFIPDGFSPDGFAPGN